MARIRTIKPEFWADEDLSELAPETHLLAAALLNYADDKGYFNANPKLIASQCVPLREDSTSVQRSIDDLSRIGYIVLGSGEDGKRYGLIRNFRDHQKIDRPKPSKIAEKSITWDRSESHQRSIDDRSESDQRGNWELGTGIRDQGGTEQSAPSEPPAEASPEFIRLPLNDKTEHRVTEADIEHWESLYPAVDVRAQLRKMLGWLESNPNKRKTAKGINRFINTWLAKDQDRGGSKVMQLPQGQPDDPGAPPKPKPFPFELVNQ